MVRPTGWRHAGGSCQQLKLLPGLLPVHRRRLAASLRRPLPSARRPQQGRALTRWRRTERPRCAVMSWPLARGPAPGTARPYLPARRGSASSTCPHLALLELRPSAYYRSCRRCSPAALQSRHCRRPSSTSSMSSVARCCSPAASTIGGTSCGLPWGSWRRWYALCGQSTARTLLSFWLHRR